jgi:tetrahydromethanopterin S-methyltransferase subunit G
MAPVDQGNPSPKDGQGASDEPEFVTQEALNRAITARLKDHERKLEKQMADFTASLPEKILEGLKDKLPTAEPQTGKSKSQEPNPMDHPEVRGLKKRLDEMETQAKQLQAERDQEQARNKDNTLRNRLQEELANSGVETRRIRHAVGLLVDSEKRVHWDEDGNILFRDADGSDIDLTNGVKSWLRTEDGKMYLPPRGTSGSGGRSPGGAGITSKEGEVNRSELARLLDGQVRELIG